MTNLHNSFDLRILSTFNMKKFALIIVKSWNDIHQVIIVGQVEVLEGRHYSREDSSLQLYEVSIMVNSSQPKVKISGQSSTVNYYYYY